MKTIRSMLKHLFLAVPLMLIVSCNSQPPSTLIPHRCENGKFGYVDEKGKECIEGKYDYAEEFSEDLAVVQVGSKIKKISQMPRQRRRKIYWITIQKRSKINFTNSNRKVPK